METHLKKIIQKFKDAKITNEDIYTLSPLALSLNEVLPNGPFFKLTPNKVSDITKPELRSNNKVTTAELFYKNGIISDAFFTTPEVSLLETTDIDKSYLFAQKLCDYNWLLGYIICFHYSHIICKVNLKNPMSNTTINVLNMGNGKGDFIAGIYYYFNHSKISSINHLKCYELDWLGVDIENTYEFLHFKKLNKYYKFKQTNEPLKTDRKTSNSLDGHILHGYVDDNLLNDNNVQYVKTTVENRFNKTNIIFNNIKPRMCNNKNKILLSVAMLSTTLHKNGIMITKILEPEYWDKHFINYLLLFALIFESTEIFRFPVCKNGKGYFRYYLTCHTRKKMLYNNIIMIKLRSMLNNDNIEHPEIIDDLIQNENIKEWKDIVLQHQKLYLNSLVNPIDELHTIIGKLKDFI